MRDDNINISDLYYDSEISGEAYLYCVEHNINTVQDLRCYDLSIVPNHIAADLHHVLMSDANETVDNEVVESADSQECLRSSKPTIDANSICEHIFYMCEDVRATNILKFCRNDWGNAKDFVRWFATCTEDELLKFRNCGRKTVNHIIQLRDSVFAGVSAEDVDLVEITNCPVAHPHEVVVIPPSESIAPLLNSIYQEHIGQLSVRATHVLESAITATEKDNIVDALPILAAPTFSFRKIKNCGKQTAEELEYFIKTIVDITKGLTTEDTELVIQQTQILDYKDGLSLSDSSAKVIMEIESAINRFPLFLAIQKHIEELPERNRLIVEGLIDIYQGQQLSSLEKLSNTLKLTRERLRQLRNAEFKRLVKYIKYVGEKFCNYKYDASNANSYNYEEQTNFQDNFIYLIMSLSNKEWTIVGDLEEVFFNSRGHQVNLNIVPTSMAEEFSFVKFLLEFERIYYARHTKEYEINLQDFCLSFFKKQIVVHLIDGIVHECKKILFRLYDCSSKGDIIIIDSNAYLPMPEIIEDILRKKGKPMTAAEIYAEFIREYPNRKCKGEASIASAAHQNHRIAPIGRSKTYSLSEWGTGTHRGGTIREFCEECILQSDEHIVSIDVLGDYVRQFRPQTKNDSIQSNLLAESSGKFALFTKGDTKYIGFKNREYDSSFVPAIESAVVVRSLSTSRQLFEEFIVTHNRFPFSSGGDVDEQERRLGRFWNNLVGRVKKGIASADEQEMYRYIEDNYSDKNIPKNEYKWRETYNTIFSYAQQYGNQFLDHISKENIDWLYINLQKSKKGRLEAWQQPLLATFLAFIKQC